MRLHDIGERYAETARDLLSGDALVAILDAWSVDAADIIDVLKAIALVKSAPQRSRDVVSPVTAKSGRHDCWRRCCPVKFMS